MERKFYWKHEISYAIIFWSITLFWLFLGMILSLEKATFHWKSLLFFALFFLFVAFNRQQFIRFSKKDLQLSSGFFRKRSVSYEDIDQIVINRNHVVIYSRTAKFECYFSKKISGQVTAVFVNLLAEKVRMETI